ncbi:MAG: AAA family ATPase [Patescibacteria group bacterium UBA2103]
MQLKALELSGFKSFGKKTTLSFTRPITAIVGPNGSGKSNVAEAFRFALGEQSIKSLRGKRGEDLIFSGTAKAPRSNKASVKVIFDNSNKLFNVDFPEVSIERTVFRDGINEYAINGSKVRLKDVHELLAHANIGQSGHHIISQGEADRILSSNPKERRNMIEEALGLRVYKYKKEEAEKKLEKTKENIGNVEGLRKEIAPHLRFLKKQVEKVERAKELKDELVVKYKEYFAIEDAWLSQEERRIKSTLEEPEKKLKEVQEEIANLPEEKPIDTSLVDAEIRKEEESLYALEKESQEAFQKLSRIEGALELAKRQVSTEERVSIHAEAFTSFRSDVLKYAEEAESADSFTGLRKSLDSILRVLRPFLDRYKTAERETVDTSDLEKEQGELKEVYEKAHEAVVTVRRKIAELKESRDLEKNKTQEGQLKRLSLSAEETKLSAIISTEKEKARRVAVEKEEFEREIRDALALIGEDAVRYEKGVEVTEERSVQENRKRDIQRLKIRVEEMGGGGDEILKEFGEVKERDEFLEKEITDLETSAASLRELIAELEKELTSTFNEGLVAINTAFNEFFVTMFGGGSARLVAQEAEEEEEVGIEVSVVVPGKRVKGLMALSGGERALTSIALIFAMSQVNPPPFLILDETDAALDEANSKRYADMIENLAKRSQLILITHNRETMSRAGVLYGVTMMGDGISKLLSIQFEEAVQVAK